MSEYHDWERLADEKNTSPFASPGSPDFLAVWRCTKCGWNVNSGQHQPAPEPTKKLFRKVPGRTEEWYNCDEIIALNIQES